MSTFPPPPPFEVWSDVAPTMWINDALQPQGRVENAVLVGEIVPGGFEAYARIFHPGRRVFGHSIEQTVALRWSEIASERAKTIHPEMQIEALIDTLDAFDYEHWNAISTGGEEWSPPHKWLEESEAIALAQVLRPHSASTTDAWFMLWDGYGDLGPGIDGIPRSVIHPRRPGGTEPAELVERTWALRHYLMFRGPLDALPGWFRWRSEAPNYWWPDDRAWIVATEIDGFSTYVGGFQECIKGVLASPLLENLPSALADRFDMRGDSVNTPLP
ncbi:MAG: hypothetical protein M3P18_15675 [Actinomycetota bacterium]|nr:hypothetical protein [Actinomycetota bacterium]